MAHTTYKTEGFVLDTRGVGEEHLYVTLLTRELGMVRAIARSARAVRSRLRYHAQFMTFGEYSLVRGRDVWRLIGARADYNAYFDLSENEPAVLFLGRYSALLRRLLAGEEPCPEIFSLVCDMLSYMRRERPNAAVIENLEYVVVLRTLLLLGYIGDHRLLNETLTLSPLTTDMLTSLAPLRRTMAAEIDRAIRESHL